jgi:4-amino-4-deoxychorismate lyase
VSESASHAPSAGALEAALLNGRAVDAAASGLSVLDRGVHFGDGLFETLACRGGRVRFLRLHLERLARGCERLRIFAPDAGLLRTECEQLASARDQALLKILVTRGPATARGYAPHGDERPTRIVLRYGWPALDPRHAVEGIAVRLANMRLGENPLLAGLKHLNRLELVMARAELADPAVFELLLFSSSGRLVSGSMSNVFIVQHGRLRTPRIDRCGVAGIMRHVVLRAARAGGRQPEEADLTRTDLDSAEEVFLTNARIGIYPVCRLESRALAPGPMTQQLQALIAPALEEPADA